MHFRELSPDGKKLAGKVSRAATLLLAASAGGSEVLSHTDFAGQLNGQLEGHTWVMPQERTTRSRVSLLPNDITPARSTIQFKREYKRIEPIASYVPTIKPERTANPWALLTLLPLPALGMLGGYKRYGVPGLIIGGASGIAGDVGMISVSGCFPGTQITEQAPLPTAVVTQISTEILVPSPIIPLPEPTTIPNTEIPVLPANSYPTSESRVEFPQTYTPFTSLDQITTQWGLQYRSMIDFYIPALQVQDGLAPGATNEQSVSNFFAKYEVRGYVNSANDCRVLGVYNRNERVFYAPVVNGQVRLDYMLPVSFMLENKPDGSDITFQKINADHMACSNKWPVAVSRVGSPESTMYLLSEQRYVPAVDVLSPQALEIAAASTYLIKSEIPGLPAVLVQVDQSVVDTHSSDSKYYTRGVMPNSAFTSEVTGQLATDSIPDANLYALWQARVKNYTDASINPNHYTGTYEEFKALVASLGQVKDERIMIPVYARDFNNPSAKPTIRQVVPWKVNTVYVNPFTHPSHPFLDHITNSNGKNEEAIGYFAKGDELYIFIGLPAFKEDEPRIYTGSGSATGQFIHALSRLSLVSETNPQLAWGPKPPGDEFSFGTPPEDPYISARLFNRTTRQVALITDPIH